MVAEVYRDQLIETFRSATRNASGGAGELDHLVEAITAGHADAVLCASIFHYGAHTVAEAKERMERAGIPVRAL